LKISLEHFLPAQWRKDKGIELEILSAHKKLYATPPATAKYKYYQLMRTLKSFGFSKFNVQQSL
jgi:talin